MALQILTLNYLLGKFQDVSMIERVLPKHSLRPTSITEFKRLLSLASHVQMKTCPCGTTCCSAALSLTLRKTAFLLRLSSFSRKGLFCAATSLAGYQQLFSLTCGLSVTFSWGERPRQQLRTCSDARWVSTVFKLNGVVKMNR